MKKQQLQKIAGLLKEESVYIINTGEDFEESGYGELASDYLIPADMIAEFEQEEAINVVEEFGTILFIVDLEGTDPTMDGSETYYSLKEDNEALSKLATILAQHDDNYGYAAKIQKGKLAEFMVFESLDGDRQFFVVEANKIVKIEKLAKKFSTK